MNFKITSRDIKVFFLGVFAAFVFVTIYDWKDFKKGFADGYKAAESSHKIQQTN